MSNKVFILLKFFSIRISYVIKIVFVDTNSKQSLLSHFLCYLTDLVKLIPDRDVEHNISYSVISENMGGGVQYVSAGEVNPRFTMEYNQFTSNCRAMYGNFTSCQAAIFMDVQNTQNLHFRVSLFAIFCSCSRVAVVLNKENIYFFQNNLVRKNQGGLYVRADSRGSATALKGWIHNNLFAENENRPALFVEGRQSSPYQQVTIYSNFWTHNSARYHNTINLRQASAILHRFAKVN